MFSQVVQDFVHRFDAVFNQPDLNIIDEIFMPDFVWHPAGLPDMDRAGLKGFIAMFYDGFPDLRQETLDVISAEDRLVLDCGAKVGKERAIGHRRRMVDRCIG